MSSKLRPCCVPRCNDRISVRHRIPRNFALQEIWLKRINNVKLIGMDTEKLQNYAVCDIHFAEFCKQGGKLKKYSLPVLHLPDFHEEPTQENSFLCQQSKLPETPEAVRALLRQKVNPTVLSSETSPELKVLHPTQTYERKSRISLFKETRSSSDPEPMNVDEPLPSTSYISMQESIPSTSTAKSIKTRTFGTHSDPEPLNIDEPVPSTSYISMQESIPSTSTAKSIKTRTFGTHSDPEPLNIDEPVPSTSYISIQKSIPSTSAAAKSVKTRTFRTQKTIGTSGIRKRVVNTMNLSLEAKMFYNTIRTLKKKLSNQKYSTSKRLAFLAKQKNLLKSIKTLNSTSLNFFMSQLRTQKFKPRGRRFSIDDKIFALSIYKQSGKLYRYLSKIFSLPSRSTITKLFNEIPFGCGINSQIFEHVKQMVEEKDPLYKYCVLIFDEISLQCGLQYNSKLDAVDGFVDCGGSERRAKFADHALVFMVRGIYKKWKQPICFTFCEGTTPTADLVRMIKNLVREIRETGLTLVASICDQGATNCAAINTLLNDTKIFCQQNNIENRYQGYLVDGIEVVHLFDFPHLLKGIRNCLLTKNIHFIQDGIEKVASWSHIQQIYENDKRRGFHSIFTKLTDEHVIPNRIRKMRVKNCSQVFSHQVGSVMRVFAENAEVLPSTSEIYLDPKAIDTADLLLFFDKLFDSVNGSLKIPFKRKPLRCAISIKSQHIDFWNSSFPILNSMYFKSATSPKRIVTPSLKNWIFSLRSLIYLWNNVRGKGFRYLAPRYLNQDPLENFFSCVRSHCGSNTNPTCSSFITTYKSLLVNNIVSTHSIGANCERDGSVGLLKNLKQFVKKQTEDSVLQPTVEKPVFPSIAVHSSESSLEVFSSAYVAGFVARKILKNIDCSNCKSKICTEENLPENIITVARQYDSSTLLHPSSKFSSVYRTVANILLENITTLITSYGIKKTLISLVKDNCFESVRSLFCTEHENNVNIFITTIVNIILFTYIKKINKVLHGKDLLGVDASNDPLLKLAYKKYLKKYNK